MEGLTLPVDGTVALADDPHADVCVRVESADVDEVLRSGYVHAAVLVADDGTRVGMKHLDNIWGGTLFGLSRGSEEYALLQGKGIAAVEFYTLEARLVVTADGGVRID